MEKKDPPTPAEAADRMRAIMETGDIVQRHGRADRLLCVLLEELGYGEVVKLYRRHTEYIE